MDGVFPVTLANGVKVYHQALQKMVKLWPPYVDTVMRVWLVYWFVLVLHDVRVDCCRLGSCS